MRPLAHVLAACALIAAASSARDVVASPAPSVQCAKKLNAQGVLVCGGLTSVTVSASDSPSETVEAAPGHVSSEIRSRPLLPLPKNPLEAASQDKAGAQPEHPTETSNTSVTPPPIVETPATSGTGPSGPDAEQAPPPRRASAARTMDAGTPSGPATTPSEAARIEAASERAKPLAEQGGRAGATASKAAEAMKAELSRGAEGAFPEGGGGALNPAGEAAAAEKVTGSDPSRPTTPQELALASTPYRDAYAAAGLRVKTDASGRPMIVRADGRPASDAEIAGLRASIAREPAALVREPGFFNTISREDYASLRSDYARSPTPDAAYKDVVKTADDRDFAWGKTCANVSGECNEAARDSYKKDELISAADLASIWKRIRTSISSRSGDDDIVSRVDRKTAEMLARLRGGAGRRGAEALGDQASEPAAIEAAMVQLPAGAAARAAPPSGATLSTGSRALTKLSSMLGFSRPGAPGDSAPSGPGPLARMAPWALILAMGALLLWIFSRR